MGSKVTLQTLDRNAFSHFMSLWHCKFSWKEEMFDGFMCSYTCLVETSDHNVLFIENQCSNCSE